MVSDRLWLLSALGSHLHHRNLYLIENLFMRTLVCGCGVLLLLKEGELSHDIDRDLYQNPEVSCGL